MMSLRRWEHPVGRQRWAAVPFYQQRGPPSIVVDQKFGARLRATVGAFRGTCLVSSPTSVCGPKDSHRAGEDEPRTRSAGTAGFEHCERAVEVDVMAEVEIFLSLTRHD